VIQPVDLADFFTVFFSAALTVISGACHALLFAFSRASGKPRWLLGAYAAYAVLVMAVIVLARAAHLHDHWQWLVWVMLAGYFFAPPAVWHLCTGTHRTEIHARHKSNVN
jgi:hypothetical protein